MIQNYSRSGDLDIFDKASQIDLVMFTIDRPAIYLDGVKHVATVVCCLTVSSEVYFHSKLKFVFYISYKCGAASQPSSSVRHSTRYRASLSLLNV